MEQERLNLAYARAPIQRLIRPGRVLFFLRTTYGTWKLDGISLETFVAALNKISQFGHRKLPGSDLAPYFKVVPQSSRKKLQIDFITEKHMFLDCLTFKIKSTDMGLELKYQNQSSGLFPLEYRFATLLGCLLFFFPFGDKDQYTTFTMNLLKDAVDKELGITSEMTLNRYIDAIKKRENDGFQEMKSE